MPTYVTTGLPNGGATTYYQFSYDNTLSTADGRDRTIALMAVADSDFAIMNAWFGGVGVPFTLPMPTQVKAGSGASASWGSSGTTAGIGLQPGNGSPLDLVRWLLCAEVTEMLMYSQNHGWFGTGDEGSTGEGLSHFLANQLMMSIGSPNRYNGPASIWLNTSPRPDWVNNTSATDNSNSEKSGCALLFLWYLYTQLGFSVNSIVAAAGANLGVVYRTLTGDTNDPFPYFKALLDAAYPNPTGNYIAGPNPDNPFPLGTLTWIVTKGTYGHDEVSTSLGSAAAGRFPNALALALDGFNGQVLGSNTPATSLAAPGFTGLTTPPDGPAQFMSTNHLIPQRITFPYDATFTSSSLAAFPMSGSETRELDGAITIAGRPFAAHTDLTFDAAGDPYFANVNPATGNVFWLSQDLRVFTATPGLNNLPVPGAGAPTFATDSPDGAYSYVQALLSWLNSTYSNPSGVDPFDPAAGVLPGQSGAYTADSSVTPTTTSGASTYNNYNFAIARVRLNGLSGAPAQTDNVRVFFRVWGTQTADTDYQPTTTYLSHNDGAGLPDYPEMPAGAHTIPFFATGNSPNLADPNNAEYGTTGVNNKSLVIPAGSSSMWAYYGCFLNVYDLANTPDGSTPVQALLPGDHHCIVAQIAYDGDPISNSGGITQSPENSDKLAQRNLQVTHSGNPGWPATHRVPQTFDLRRSPATPDRGDLLGYPDELVVDWGNAPKGTTAQIFWPGASAADIIDVASRLYGVHQLSVVDPETIGCEADGKLTYIPIPTDAPDDLAGLLTLDMPAGVRYGEEYNVVVRRIATRRPEKESRRSAPAVKRAVAMSEKKATKRAAVPGQPQVTVVVDDQGPVTELNTESLSWRYVVGSFQVKVPVTDEHKMLAAEEDALAIFRWRLRAMPQTSRWHRVLSRYVGYRAEKVDALGGDAAKIPPSLHGRPTWSTGKPRRDDDVEFTGKVATVHYDSFGDFSGFTVRTDDDGEHSFESRERAVERVVRDAWEERATISVVVDRDRPRRPEAIILRRP
jgi:hypothetical protein